MPITKERVHSEWFRTVEAHRKSCSNCKAKLPAGESIWSRGEYHIAKWRTVSRFCIACWPVERARMLAHAGPCGCKFGFRGYRGQELPRWLTLQRTRNYPRDIEQIARDIGVEVSAWEGQCYMIADKIREHYHLDAAMQYGHYTGPVSSSGYWADRVHLSFQPHAWLRLYDGCIYDPTRWSFEAVAPYIYVGSASDEYDLGGLRMLHAQRPFPSRSRPGETLVKLDGLTYCEKEQTVLTLWFGCWRELSLEQLHWLANLPLEVLGSSAEPIYRAIIRAGHKALIPLDARMYILGE